MCMSVCLSVYFCMCLVPMKVRKVSDSLELELWIAVRHSVGAWNWNDVLCKSDELLTMELSFQAQKLNNFFFTLCLVPRWSELHTMKGELVEAFSWQSRLLVTVSNKRVSLKVDWFILWLLREMILFLNVV